MQTNLKLVSGSYFFLDHVSLVRNVPTQVDFSTLPAKEVKVLRDYITSGHIESDNGVPDLIPTPVSPVVPEVVEETTVEAPKTYSEMTNKELKEELEARGIETKLNAKKDLIALLEEDDKEE